MARVVESVVPAYEDSVCFEKVVTKEMEGAIRYGELSKRLGRPAPVPSIFADGELVFEMTPSTEDLSGWLDRHLTQLSLKD